MDYDVQEVPERTYAVIRRTVPFPEVPTAMQELIGQVHGWAATVEHGQSMCISSMTDDGRLNIAPGVEVEPGVVDPPEPFELVTRPARRSAVHLYVGPYEGLPGVYQELYDALKRDGLTEAGEPIEIYEQHDPVPQTRIEWPVA
jgi:predicted transcriptional regulator YdeE